MTTDYTPEEVVGTPPPEVPICFGTLTRTDTGYTCHPDPLPETGYEPAPLLLGGGVLLALGVLALVVRWAVRR